METNRFQPHFIFLGLCLFLAACGENFQAQSSNLPLVTTYSPEKPVVRQEKGYRLARGATNPVNLQATYDEKSKMMSLSGDMEYTSMVDQKSQRLTINLQGVLDTTTDSIKLQGSVTGAEEGVQVAAKATCLSEEGTCYHSFIDIYIKQNGVVYHHQMHAGEAKATENTQEDYGDDPEEDDSDGLESQGMYVGSVQSDIEEMFDLTDLQGEEEAPKASSVPSEPAKTAEKKSEPKANVKTESDKKVEDKKTDSKSNVATEAKKKDSGVTPAAPSATAEKKDSKKETPTTPPVAGKTAAAPPVKKEAEKKEKAKSEPVKAAPVEKAKVEKPAPPKKETPVPETPQAKEPEKKEDKKDQEKKAQEVKKNDKKEDKKDEKQDDKKENKDDKDDKKEAPEKNEDEKPAATQKAPGSSLIQAVGPTGTTVINGKKVSGSLKNAVNMLELSKKPKSGFHILYPQRETYYGTNEMAFILTEIARFTQKTLPGYSVAVGDISYRSGGKLGKHASHQNGNDADVGFYFDNEKSQSFFDSALSKGALRSDWMASAQWKLFKNIVNTKYVDRIFIHPLMKKKLCQIAIEKGELTKETENGLAFETLRRLRPEAGHYDHFHVRVKCSSAQRACYQMVDPVATSGCF